MSMRTCCWSDEHKQHHPLCEKILKWEKQLKEEDEKLQRKKLKDDKKKKR